MRTHERGSALIIATIVVVVVAVIGVGILRYSSREAAGAAAGQRAEALSTCADAARQLLQSRFHALGQNPTQISVLSERMDGATGRFRALGGHVDTAPTSPLVTIGQVTTMPKETLGPQDVVNLDVTNTLSGQGGVGSPVALGGSPLKVTVHCQEGDLSSWTSGRQLEIEFGVKFGL